jgi:hypothetical protein
MIPHMMKAKKRSIKKPITANPPSGVMNHVMTFIGLGILWILTKPKPGVQGVEAVLDAAPVLGGETVSADSYRRIQDRRPGMTYVQCEGALGGRLTFNVSKAGVFTRNVVVYGGTVWAEIAGAP